MEHLLKVWDKIEPLLGERSLMLSLDFDGTLTPIVEHPGLARLSPGVKEIIGELSQPPEVTVAIMSGRMLEELKAFVGVPDLIYVGNHGLEVEGPYLRHIHPGAFAARPQLQKLLNDLRRAFDGMPGIFVENKIFTLSIHYRQLTEERIESAKQILLKTAHPYQGDTVLREGKKVWEIRPVTEWGKGTALLWLYGRLLVHAKKEILPIYVGDDDTDEDAFKAIRGKGISVKVTEDVRLPTSADYYLKSTEEVYEFFESRKSRKILAPVLAR